MVVVGRNGAERKRERRTLGVCIYMGSASGVANGTWNKEKDEKSKAETAPVDRFRHWVFFPQKIQKQ